MLSTLYFLPADSSFQTSINSTLSLPLYSFVNSSRTGTIILHGMHFVAPRSNNLGSFFGVVAVDFAFALVFFAAAGFALTVLTTAFFGADFGLTAPVFTLVVVFSSAL